MKSKPPAYLMSEPDSRIKAAALILWQFAHLHGLCMDLCGKRCAREALDQVENLYQVEKEESCPTSKE